MSLDFPWDSSPRASLDDVELRTVSPGIQWMCLPLPFALDHVNVWFLADGKSTIVIDTGVASASTKELWQLALPQLQSNLSGLVVTHYHPDHAGLAGWFAANHTMPIWFSQQEWALANGAWDATDEAFSTSQDAWFQRHGLDVLRRKAMASVGNSYRPYVHELVLTPTMLADGDVLELGDSSWEVICVGGHAPEMICLYSAADKVLIAADQVLPTISPNVSMSFHTNDKDPLGSFLRDLRRLALLPDDVLVLPSHGLPFTGLKNRIIELLAHHEQRFDAIRGACSDAMTATDMLPVLFKRKLNYQQLMFAMGESIAHMNHLADSGALERVWLNDVEHFRRLDE